MELVTPILAVVMPVLLKSSMDWIKKIRPLPSREDRVLWIRAIVAVLGVAGAVLTLWSGGEVDLASLEALVSAAILALINAFGATWIYVQSKEPSQV